MKPLHFKQCIDVPALSLGVYRSRFITNAKQPANSPPPKIVVPNERYGLAPLLGGAPSNSSRTPPCTISTERVSSAPIANHHPKDLTGVLETERPGPQSGAHRHCSRGSTGCQEDCPLFTPPRDRRCISLTEVARREQSPLSILDGERWRHFHCRCPP